MQQPAEATVAATKEARVTADYHLQAAGDGWLSWYSIDSVEIHRPEVRTQSGAQEQIVRGVKKVVLARCRCAQPPRVYA